MTVKRRRSVIILILCPNRGLHNNTLLYLLFFLPSCDLVTVNAAAAAAAEVSLLSFPRVSTDEQLRTNPTTGLFKRI